MNKPVSLFWFRRDLRLHDNAGLYHALKSGNNIQCVFIFDKNILDRLEDKKDGRVIFIHRQIEKLNDELKSFNSEIITFYGSPEEAFGKWITEFSPICVFTNHDYEPYAIDRDEKIKAILNKNNSDFKTFKDQVIFEKSEVVKDNGEPYTIYTPYKNKYLAKLNSFFLLSYPVEKYNKYFNKSEGHKINSLEEMGFENANVNFPKDEVSKSVLKNYTQTRNFPATDSTSRIGIHLRFGTVSIRELARAARQLNSETWFNELVWRDFYQMILWHFPQVVYKAFKPAYDKIEWRNSEPDFLKWCEGKTGYPIVDAGMRQLNETGFMHNRVRMITASFLTKHLLIDWRWGEAYFAKKLLDFDLAANNGGWQWASGSGTDSAPYFRIFNPSEQVKKFDSDLKYIRKWVPELDEFSYPQPMVEHTFARERCLATYKKALSAVQ